MKGDPEYAHAVNNLRIHQCSGDDVNLFDT